jgi:hypothetical protein
MTPPISVSASALPQKQTPYRRMQAPLPLLSGSSSSRFRGRLSALMFAGALSRSGSTTGRLTKSACRPIVCRAPRYRMWMATERRAKGPSPLLAVRRQRSKSAALRRRKGEPLANGSLQERAKGSASAARANSPALRSAGPAGPSRRTCRRNPEHHGRVPHVE